jgi:beta-barrel assembly-enhancing protease
MKRWVFLLLILGASVAALYYSQRHKVPTSVGPQAVLNALADTQREISRLPAGLVRLSDENEKRVGDAMAKHYLAGSGASSAADTQLANYVSTVGRQVSAHARRKLNYRFHYLPDANLVNAFALPGGHVFIGKGLILLMDSEDELAGVLGHEVEHVDNYHCNDRVALESRLRHLPLGELVALPVELFQAGYSKEQELEADRDGTRLAVLAGYSPQGTLRMFQTFARLQRKYVTKAENPGQELSQVAIDGILGYFRSHPLPAEREQQIRRIMASQKWPQPAEKALKVKPESVKTARVNH